MDSTRNRKRKEGKRRNNNRMQSMGNRWKKERREGEKEVL